MNNSWWPSAGYRDAGSAALLYIGHGGWYWSSSRYTTTPPNAFRLGFTYDGSVSPSYNSLRSHGLSVRCIEDTDK